MDFFYNIWNFGGIHILTYFAVMSVIVFVHELGHFLMGRWCGVKIDAFSLGLGPELFGFDDRHGTHWRVAAFPLGGYVKFHGDANGASVPDSEAMAQMPAAEKSVTLAGQKVWKRAAIVAAGPLANFLLTIAIFSGMYMYYGQDELLPHVGTVIQGSAAETAGFKKGDIVVAMDGRAINSWQEMTAAILNSANKPLAVEVERAGARLELTATPRVEFDNGIAKSRLGLGPALTDADFRYTSVGVVDAIGLGGLETWHWVQQTGTSLRQLILGKASLDQVSGPPGIAQALGEVAKHAPDRLIKIIAILSLSIGLFNLLPVPLLDGGHLMFYAFEALRGRPLQDRVQEYGFRFGMLLVGSLLVFVVSNDFWKILHSAGWM